MSSGEVAKVVFHDTENTSDTTWIDVTDKTVNELNLFANNTALRADGTDVTGTVNFNINNTDGTKTLGTISLNTSTGVVTATYIDIDTLLYYSSFESFPAVGSDSHLYIDKGTNSIYAWYDSTGYVKIGGSDIYTNTTNIRGVSSWDAGSPTILSVASNAPTLVVTSGESPTLTTYTSSVITEISDTPIEGPVV